MTFSPRLDVLPQPQRELWPELATVPRRYVLYGGTALALRLAHRPSVDFDFFAHDHLDHRELETVVPFMRDAVVLDERPDTRTVLVARAGGEVKISFFGGIAQKTLCYFKGGDLESLDSDMRARLLAAAGHDVTPSTLALRSPRLD